MRGGRDFPDGKSLPLVDCFIHLSHINQQLLSIIFLFFSKMANTIWYRVMDVWVEKQMEDLWHKCHLKVWKSFLWKDVGGKTFVWTECKIWAGKCPIYSHVDKREKCVSVGRKMGNNIHLQTISSSTSNILQHTIFVCKQYSPANNVLLYNQYSPAHNIHLQTIFSSKQYPNLQAIFYHQTFEVSIGSSANISN